MLDFYSKLIENRSIHTKSFSPRQALPTLSRSNPCLDNSASASIQDPKIFFGSYDRSFIEVQLMWNIKPSSWTDQTLSKYRKHLDGENNFSAGNLPQWNLKHLRSAIWSCILISVCLQGFTILPHYSWGKATEAFLQSILSKHFMLSFESILC